MRRHPRLRGRDIPRDVHLHVEATDKQKEILQHPARFKVLRCGRRWGKTTIGTLWDIEGIFDEHPPDDSLVWWVAPTYRHCKKPFRMMQRMAPALIKDTYKDPPVIVFINGEILEFRSAEYPDHLRGEKLRRVVVDEAGEMSNYAFESCLYPCLLDCGGTGLILGTPVVDPGHWLNVFYKIGQKPNDRGIKSWRLPSPTNPYLHPKELAEAKETMSDAAWRLEIMVEEGVTGSPFFEGSTLAQMLQKSTSPLYVEQTKSGHTFDVWDRPRSGVQYVIGADVAEGVPGGDYSTATVLERRGVEELVQVASFRDHVAADTFGGILLDIASFYMGAKLVVEKNGPGIATVLYIQSHAPLLLAPSWDITKGKLHPESFGWRTDGDSKTVMTNDLRTWLRLKRIDLVQRGLILESLAFHADPKGKTFLAGGRKSGFTKMQSPDRIISLCLALQGHIRIPFLHHIEVETPEQANERAYRERRKSWMERITGKPSEAPCTLYEP